MKSFETKIFTIHDGTRQAPDTNPYNAEVEGPEFIPEPDAKTVIEHLNEYGAAGWEVVHIFHWDSYWARVLLQREVPGRPYRD